MASLPVSVTSPLVPQLATFCFTIACAVIAVGHKRLRALAEGADPKRKRRRNDVERGELRKSSVRRILAIDPFVFKCHFFTICTHFLVLCPPCSHSVCRKMFRMDKTSFLNLHSKIKDVLCKSWTARSARMAKVSSVSHVSSLLHFASTLRWLAGGSPWDIAYAFHVSYATLHAKKYKVVEAINQALHNNIAFPTSEAELQRLVRTPRTRLTSPPLPSPTLPSRSQA